MTYLTRSVLLNYLKRYCLTTVGFDEAFAHADMTILTNLFYMIEEHTHMHVHYEEYVDFLDGNGFSVEKDIDGWYFLSYIYKEKP